MKEKIILKKVIFEDFYLIGGISFFLSSLLGRELSVRSGVGIKFSVFEVWGGRLDGYGICG